MKKGFTLLEMLAVLCILAILALLILPIIGRQMHEANDTLYEEQIDAILGGASSFASDHLDLLPSVEGEIYPITLGTLQDGGYVSKKLINPKTKKEFPSTLQIQITFRNNQYYYKVIDA